MGASPSRLALLLVTLSGAVAAQAERTRPRTGARRITRAAFFGLATGNSSGRITLGRTVDPPSPAGPCLQPKGQSAAGLRQHPCEQSGADISRVPQIGGGSLSLANRVRVSQSGRLCVNDLDIEIPATIYPWRAVRVQTPDLRSGGSRCVAICCRFFHFRDGNVRNARQTTAIQADSWHSDRDDSGWFGAWHGGRARAVRLVGGALSAFEEVSAAGGGGKDRSEVSLAESICLACTLSLSGLDIGLCVPFRELRVEWRCRFPPEFGICRRPAHPGPAGAVPARRQR